MIIAAMTGFGAEAKDVAFGRIRLQVLGLRPEEPDPAAGAYHVYP